MPNKCQQHVEFLRIIFIVMRRIHDGSQFGLSRSNNLFGSGDKCIKHCQRALGRLLYNSQLVQFLLQAAPNVFIFNARKGIFPQMPRVQFFLKAEIRSRT